MIQDKVRSTNEIYNVYKLVATHKSAPSSLKN